MKRILLILFILITFINTSNGQNLPVEIISSANRNLMDGIYINFDQFIENNPVSFTRLAVDGNINDSHTISKAMAQKYIYLIGLTPYQEKIKTASVWGYCFNGNLYVNIGRLFLLVPTIETLSRIPEKVPEQWFIDRVENPIDERENQETSYQFINSIELIVDLRTGKIHRSEPIVLFSLFSKDTTLTDEYASLSRRKQKRRKLKYINIFNERNPLNLHKNNQTNKTE